MKWNKQKIVSKLTRRIEVIPLGARQLAPAKIQQHCPSSIVFIFNLNLPSTCLGSIKLLTVLIFNFNVLSTCLVLNSFLLKLYLFFHSQSQSEFPHIFRKSFLSIWAEKIRNQKKRSQRFLPLVFVIMMQNSEQWSTPQDSWQDNAGEDAFTD